MKKMDKGDGNNQNSDSLRDKAKPSSLVSSPSSRSEAATSNVMMVAGNNSSLPVDKNRFS